jgi:type IV fimbrial biogenesis protein FimT
MTNVQTSPNGLQPIADRRASMGGFTLLELMLVITIAAILSGIGVPSFSRFIAEQRTIAAASDIQMALWRVRSEAIRLRADVRLVPMPLT